VKRFDFSGVNDAFCKVFVLRFGVQKYHLVLQVTEACSPVSASLLLLLITSGGAAADEPVFVSNNKVSLAIYISVT